MKNEDTKEDDQFQTSQGLVALPELSDDLEHCCDLAVRITDAELDAFKIK